MTSKVTGKVTGRFKFCHFYSFEGHLGTSLKLLHYILLILITIDRFHLILKFISLYLARIPKFASFKIPMKNLPEFGNLENISGFWSNIPQIR